MKIKGANIDFSSTCLTLNDQQKGRTRIQLLLIPITSWHVKILITSENQKLCGCDVWSDKWNRQMTSLDVELLFWCRNTKLNADVLLFGSPLPGPKFFKSSKCSAADARERLFVNHPVEDTCRMVDQSVKRKTFPWNTSQKLYEHWIRFLCFTSLSQKAQP